MTRLSLSLAPSAGSTQTTDAVHDFKVTVVHISNSYAGTPPSRPTETRAGFTSPKHFWLDASHRPIVSSNRSTLKISMCYLLAMTNAGLEHKSYARFQGWLKGRDELELLVCHEDALPS
jgi:hypothetical protein